MITRARAHTDTGSSQRPLRIWLTGSSGMLGNAVLRALSRAKHAFLATDRDLDVTDRSRVTDFAVRHRPTHIINCAAYTAVDEAESESKAAYAVNRDGAENLWLAARETGATLVHFSTDYVFDGRSARPYTEDAPCNPLGVYGRSKRAGETRILGRSPFSDTGARAYVVRTSWLFGPGGKNFVRTMLRLMAERDVLRVVSDQKGRPTYTVDLADAALRLCGLEPHRPFGGDGSRQRTLHGAESFVAPPGLYHFSNQGATSWHEFAMEILECARCLGFPVRTRTILRARSDEIRRPASRPESSILDTSRLEAVLGARPRHWRLALADYLAVARVGAPVW